MPWQVASVRKEHFSGRVTPRELGFKLRLNSVHIFETLGYVLLCESAVELGPLTPCNFSYRRIGINYALAGSFSQEGTFFRQG
jgi:hypothetical protein